MKLKPLSDPKELANIPLDRPVLVELEPEKKEDDLFEGETGIEKKPQEEKTGEQILKEQLAATKEANKEANKRADDLRKERDEAVKIANTKNAELHAVRLRGDAADADSIDAALNAAQAERLAAREALKRATTDADPDAMADANEKLSRAATDIRNLEIAKNSAVQHIERNKTSKPEEIQLSRSNDPVAAIESNANLLASEKDWLKGHPELAPRGDELGKAYNLATATHARGTPGYFAKMNEYFGFSAEAQRTEEDSDESEVMTQAPVNRSAPNLQGGNASPSRITLTPEQREMAKSLGLTDVAYARQVKNLNDDKKANAAKYGMQS